MDKNNMQQKGRKVQRYLQKALMLMGTMPVLLALFAACSEDSDTSLPRTTCGVFFYDLNAQRRTVDSLTVAALTDHGDSILYHLYSGESISLPLRYIGDSTQFRIQQGEHIADTLTIVHQNTPNFVSLDAGYTMNYEILRIRFTQYAIDTVTIATTSITTYEQENLDITYP